MNEEQKIIILDLEANPPARVVGMITEYSLEWIVQNTPWFTDTPRSKFLFEYNTRPGFMDELVASPIDRPIVLFKHNGEHYQGLVERHLLDDRGPHFKVVIDPCLLVVRT